MTGFEEATRPELETRFEPIVFADPAPTPKGVGALVAALSLGCVALMMLGVQPMVLGALLADHRLTIAQLTQAATVEMLALGLVSGAMAGLLQHRRLRLFGAASCAVLIGANLACLVTSGLGLVICRGFAGAAGGVLVWIATGLITRSPSAVRVSAIFLGAQALSQAALAGLLPSLAQGLGANAGFVAIAVLGAVSLPMLYWITPDLPALPKAEPGAGALTIPGLSGLMGTFLMMAGVVGLWVFIEPLAKVDRVAPGLTAFAVAASLVMQVVGAVFLTAFGARLPAGRGLILVALGNLLVVATIAVLPNSIAFVAATLVFGFLWTLGIPLFVPLLIKVDPTRRAAMLLAGAQLLGGSVGPQLTGALATDADVRPVLWAAAGLFLAAGACVALALAPRRRAPA